MLRQTLGDFSSIVCFKAAIEDALGEKAAGSQRGKSLAKELALETLASLEDITVKIRSALGVEGTRLCIVEK